MSTQTFVGRTISVTSERRSYFTALLPRYVEARRPLRVLDVGCGTGGQLLDLARALPRATLVGVDLSPANIEAARAARRRSPLGRRVEFVCGDYLALRMGPFDLIVSDTTLHLIPAPTETLYARLSGDLRPGGFLFQCMPYACWYNRALGLARSVLRVGRGRWTDALLFRAGRLLHGRDFSDEAIRERLCYMYLLPYRYDGPALRRLARSFGLQAIGQHAVPHASLAKPRHRTAVFRKSGAERRPGG
jgi:SAM-dependent methyltransferase